MMLDRGELKDWFGSTEIWVEATVAAFCFYLFVVHTATDDASSFLNRRCSRTRNFTAGIILMFFVGIILNGTMVLLPTMMQVLMNYPVVTAGFVMAPRGVGTLISMILVAGIIGKVDTRLIIFCGLALTALSLWQMTGFSLEHGHGFAADLAGRCRGSASASCSRRSRSRRSRPCRAST